MTGWKELLISILKIGASAPHEFTRQPRVSDCHARRIASSGHGADGFADESLRHELTDFFRP